MKGTVGVVLCFGGVCAAIGALSDSWHAPSHVKRGFLVPETFPLWNVACVHALRNASHTPVPGMHPIHVAGMNLVHLSR